MLEVVRKQDIAAHVETGFGLGVARNQLPIISDEADREISTEIDGFPNRLHQVRRERHRDDTRKDPAFFEPAAEDEYLVTAEATDQEGGNVVLTAGRERLEIFTITDVDWLQTRVGGVQRSAVGSDHVGLHLPRQSLKSLADVLHLANLQRCPTAFNEIDEPPRCLGSELIDPFCMGGDDKARRGDAVLRSFDRRVVRLKRPGRRQRDEACPRHHNGHDDEFLGFARCISLHK